MPIKATLDHYVVRTVSNSIQSPIDILVPNKIPVSGRDPEGLSGTRTYERFIINIRDENNHLADGHNAVVTYQGFLNGIPQETVSVSISGQSFDLGEVLVSDTNPENYQFYTIVLVGDLIENDGTYIPPGSSNLAIQNVIVNQKESAIGAHDGQATIVASSSFGPIMYSLDNITFQTDATFSQLAGGGYSVYVKDAIAYSLKSYPFNIPTIESVLIKDPTFVTGDGNTSRWSAAFNPIIFTYQRKDFGINNIFSQYGTNKLCLIINQNLASLQVHDSIFVQAGWINNGYAYRGVYQVLSVNQNTVVVDADYTEPGTITGYINIDALRPYYHIKTRITYQSKLTGRIDTITAQHRPDSFGLTYADMSSFLQSILRVQDDSDYTQVNFRDDNLSASYTISYAEAWDGHEATFITINTPYYTTYAAKQLGDFYGGNIAEYVPFKHTIAPSKRAKWITDFAEPAYSNGYPFDIGFIYSEDMAGLNIFCEITPLDINHSALTAGVQTTYLLNEDGSFLLNQDSSRLLIAKQKGVSQPISQAMAQHIGLNRLNINTSFADEVKYFTLALKYTDDSGTHTITQTQTVRVDDAVDDQSVYLRWIGLTGSWNYYRFVYNQEITLDVQNAVIVKNYVRNWATQQGIEEVISKSAGQKMKVMAEDLSVADIKGLQSIKYSPKVQMLMSSNPVRWQTVVLNTATFAEYETRNGQAPFNITFNLPALNIQTQ